MKVKFPMHLLTLATQKDMIDGFSVLFKSKYDSLPLKLESDNCNILAHKSVFGF